MLMLRDNQKIISKYTNNNKYNQVQIIKILENAVENDIFTYLQDWVELHRFQAKTLLLALVLQLQLDAEQSFHHSHRQSYPLLADSA